MEDSDPDIRDMRRLQAGEDLALNDIMARWQGRVCGYLMRLTANASVAEDLAEETFVRLYQGRHRYRPDGKFSTWLFAIATNLARHHARWQARHPAVSLDGLPDDSGLADSETPDGDLLKREKAHSVRKALETLPADLREAVVLFEYEGLSHSEIAGISRCSRKAVETRLYRARARLRELLKPFLLST